MDLNPIFPNSHSIILWVLIPTIVTWLTAYSGESSDGAWRFGRNLEKKRNTDDDLPPHWKCGSENNNYTTRKEPKRNDKTKRRTKRTLNIQQSIVIISPKPPPKKKPNWSGKTIWFLKSKEKKTKMDRPTRKERRKHHKPSETKSLLNINHCIGDTKIWAYLPKIAYLL